MDTQTTPAKVQPAAQSKQTEAAQTIALPEMPYSWNVRVESSLGYEEQFTLRDTDGTSFFKRIEGAKSWLVANEYKPIKRGNGSATPGKPDSDARGKAEFDAPSSASEQTEEDEEFPFKAEHAKNALTCPKCGSNCYDNRNDPNSKPTSPLLKCKNQNCDWRQWPARTRTGGDSARANTKKARERTGRF